MMDYLAKMIEELQKTQEYASQNAPLVPHKEELAEADAEPRLDLSANKVDAAASALRGSEEAPAEEPPAPGREPRCSARPGRRGAADEHGRHAVAGLF